MIKKMWLMRRRPGMSREDFVRYYEEVHSKLVEATFHALLAGYRRNYPVPSIEAAARSFPYDVVVELWFADSDAMHAASGIASNSAVAARISEDECRLFDRPSMVTFLVDEYPAVCTETPACSSTTAPEAGSAQ